MVGYFGVYMTVIGGYGNPWQYQLLRICTGISRKRKQTCRGSKDQHHNQMIVN